MIILAIETSCDDTCVALLKAKQGRNPSFQILSNIVSSQTKLHAKYGGIWPTLAKREHKKNLPLVLRRAEKAAGTASGQKKADLIAVTVGPGLEPCLWEGINLAKKLTKQKKLPLVPVNHIEAHILANFVGENSKFEIRNSKFLFPAICLVVSGGHTQLILMKDFGNYKIIGETRDDAAGECFDKTARILGLGYPGGPAIAVQAAKLKTINHKPQTKLPRPMMYTKDYDFSFSGLKTAVLYNYQSQKPSFRKSEKYINAMCKEIQQAIIDVLIHKTLKAAKNYRVKSVILGGGVSANTELRKQFKERIKQELPIVKYLVPKPELCTDNAAPVAVAGYYLWLQKKYIAHSAHYNQKKEIEAKANLTLPIN